MAPRKKTIEQAQHDAEAARLRAQGWGYAQIGEKLGVSMQGAHQAVQRALTAAVREPADDVRALELSRLDLLWQAAWTVLTKHHVTVQQGKVVYLGDEPLEDDAPVLNAIDRLLKVQDRRAKLLGLDAPTRHEVITLDAIDQEIAKLTRELGGRDVLDARRRKIAEAAGTEGPAAPS